MISVDKLNERLCGNYDDVITVLEELGLSNIHPNQSKHEIRCSREEGRNPTSVRLNIENLSYRCFSTGEKGNLYTLVMDRLNKTFPQALKWVSGTLGIDSTELKQKSIKLPFGGYFKKIMRQIEEPELSMQKYDEEILYTYADNYSLMFQQDGIDYETQKHFHVGYDPFSNRITIPQWDINGNLVGIMGRLNQTEESDYRWLPLIPCQRSLTLYGYHFNYRDIQAQQYCFIGESEKFVMQLHAMGINNALATCGCDISATQAKYIKSLMCRKIIVCFDEGLTEDQIMKQAKKLKMKNPIFENEVGYIYDADGDIMQINSKCSPSDLGVDKFIELVETKVKWIGGDIHSD